MNFRKFRFLVVLTSLVSLFAVDALAAPGGRGRKRRPPVVSVKKVIERGVRSQLTVVGTVDPYRKSRVSSEIEGRVKSVPLREGDPVVAGKTVIAALERSDLEIDLRIEKAELAKARQDYLRLKSGSRPEEIQVYRSRLKERKAELDRDELGFKRVEDLYRKKILDKASYDQAVAKLQVSKSKYIEEQSNLRISEIGPRKEEVARANAEVARMRAKVAFIQDKLRKAVIRSPLSGFLTEKLVEVGQWVAKGGQVGEVVETRKLLVRAPVSERQISYVIVGDSARVKLDAIPGRVFTGLIARIIPKGDTKSRTFPVEVELDNTKNYEIKTGMFARIILEYGDSKQAVLVPKDALLIRPRGVSIFIFEKGKVREVSFLPGRNVDSLVEVPGGLVKPGMKVVVQGNEKLRNGMAVSLRGKGGRRGGRPGAGKPGSGKPAAGGKKKGSQG
ncbi:MAG: efflux RND transporter periplasmic adaptor subunit [Nitrospinaceae bacterium]|nr:efflux RND transporter periplasmic adaptor subunit [Nitrospinaceae bacterium]MBT4095181.1 efflux RND transporter periplasmic adaptor subunit [Nitrospinaceae bacterium]MBT4430109.1 efflux RND transporter periplasmic adaptor subunit [Nitrospinaceae bacterium]MBT5369148.1 efflux RND transporter periplasmic adaptor subunit [Nitrospinaceae bacterium]MBT5948640.1 efflux RND transporter periplasmic adaptor subunit [Nitrospinaceae bacterium]